MRFVCHLRTVWLGVRRRAGGVAGAILLVLPWVAVSASEAPRQTVPATLTTSEQRQLHAFVRRHLLVMLEPLALPAAQQNELLDGWLRDARCWAGIGYQAQFPVWFLESQYLSCTSVFGDWPGRVLLLAPAHDQLRSAVRSDRAALPQPNAMTPDEALAIVVALDRRVLPDVGPFHYARVGNLWSFEAPQLAAPHGIPLERAWRRISLDAELGYVVQLADQTKRAVPVLPAPVLDETAAKQRANAWFTDTYPTAKVKDMRLELHVSHHLLHYGGSPPAYRVIAGWCTVWEVHISTRWPRGDGLYTSGVHVVNIDAVSGQVLSDYR